MTKAELEKIFMEEVKKNVDYIVKIGLKGNYEDMSLLSTLLSTYNHLGARTDCYGKGMLEIIKESNQNLTNRH